MFTWTTLASVVPKLEPIMKALVVRIENDYRCRQPRKQRRSLSQRVTWRVTDVRSHHLSCSQESTPNATTYLRRCGLCATTQPRYNALNAPQRTRRPSPCANDTNRYPRPGAHQRRIG